MPVGCSWGPWTLHVNVVHGLGHSSSRIITSSHFHLLPFHSSDPSHSHRIFLISSHLHLHLISSDLLVHLLWFWTDLITSHLLILSPFIPSHLSSHLISHLSFHLSSPDLFSFQFTHLISSRLMSSRHHLVSSSHLPSHLVAQKFLSRTSFDNLQTIYVHIYIQYIFMLYGDRTELAASVPPIHSFDEPTRQASTCSLQSATKRDKISLLL